MNQAVRIFAALLLAWFGICLLAMKLVQPTGCVAVHLRTKPETMFVQCIYPAPAQKSKGASP